LFGSQISQQNLELISGMKLEESSPIDFYDEKLRNYTLAALKTLITISNKGARLNKELPKFLSEIREIKKKTSHSLPSLKIPCFIGKLRSGSKVLDVDISLPCKDVFPITS